MKRGKPKVEVLEECGCCGAYHRRAFNGDCRQDAERFHAPILIDGVEEE